MTGNVHFSDFKPFKTHFAMQFSKFTFLLSFLLTAFTVASFAQDELSKAEVKEWKKKLKKMDVMEFKDFVERHSDKKRQYDALSSQFRKNNKILSDLEAQLRALQDFVQAELAKLEGGGGNGGASASTNNSSTTAPDYSKGTVWRVQVGAFKNNTLEKYINHNRFHAEVDADGKKKYTICTFWEKEYDQANQFKRFLRELGVTDAWVVSYRDGQRIDIKDALEARYKEQQESNQTPEGGAENGGSNETAPANDDEDDW